MSNFEPLALYATITQAFADLSADGRVDAVKFGQAAALVAPLYDRIFGEGFIANHLKDDIIGHGLGLARAAEVDTRYRYVDEMVPAMVQEKGIDNIRGRWGDGVMECLWTKRALDFILRFLEYGIVTRTDTGLHECARKAYEEVLRPYHGFPVATIVKLAFNLAPKREQFLTALGFQDLSSAQAKLKQFLAIAKPVIDSVHKTLVENDCDFPDTV